MSPIEAKQLILSTKLQYKPGSGFTYSDIGADILGWVVESAANEPLDRFLHERVFAPLGMRSTGFKPADSLRYRIAPTETSPPRGYPLRGEVHDENAFALGGIVAPAISTWTSPPHCAAAVTVFSVAPLTVLLSCSAITSAAMVRSPSRRS